METNNVMIQETKIGKEIKYRFENNGLFAQTAYNYIRKTKNCSFAECCKINENGISTLIYFVSSYSTLYDLKTKIRTTDLLSMCMELIDVIQKIDKDSFLDARALLLSEKRIYLSKDRIIKLIYLPIREGDNYISEKDFENEFRKFLSRFLESTSNISDHNVSVLKMMLENQEISLEYILNEFAKAGIKPNHVFNKKTDCDRPDVLLLSRRDRKMDEAIIVDHSDFIIGKKSCDVDGLIKEDTISRHHCKIIQNENKYYVIDLGSANGTFLNGYRLEVNEMYLVQSGDVLRMAKFEYDVSIGKYNGKI